MLKAIETLAIATIIAAPASPAFARGHRAPTSIQTTASSVALEHHAVTFNQLIKNADDVRHEAEQMLRNPPNPSGIIPGP